MSAIFAPLFQAATYARWFHLLIGMVFAAAVLLVYPGIEGQSLTRLLLSAVLVDAVILALAALVPAMRRAEGVQARLLLMPAREEDIGAARSTSWADRRRTAGWLIGRVALGTAMGFLTVHGLANAVDLAARPFHPLAPAAAPLLLLALGWTAVLAGRIQLAMAVRLLGPSPAERLAEAELRAERLLERNRLARELHDSIGHALTVTVLQAGAAREVTDQAFRDKVLEVIETTGRRAMEDLERTLVLLRDTPDAVATEQPGLDQVGALFETARAAGSSVEARIAVRADQVPGVLSREAYRIVQEGITNALKYAPGTPIRVRAAIEDGSLRLRCATAIGGTGTESEPPGRAARADGSGGRRGGKGLRGIRERAVLLGGESHAGPDPDGGADWVLAVRLPLRLGE
ncbi:sensor histidine kinase [Kitasatospora camelliae]|uniref:histidine kinase n=1 Tax=Kitasatospora camelliae TaxID=3156397 RepID=A0AAU8K0Q9_9ACTN